MTHLLWPTRSQQYFLLAHSADLGDELDEFNEAPHVLNSGYTSLRNNSIISNSAQVSNEKVHLPTKSGMKPINVGDTKMHRL